MNLYMQWKKLLDDSSSDQAKQYEFWKDFCQQEKGIYQAILSEKKPTVEGTVRELASKYRVSNVYFMGFLDGINESVKKPIALEEVDEDTLVKFDIDFKLLYKNMLAVPAEWLYNLEEWSGILTDEERKQIKKDYNRSKIVVNNNKIGRNEPCYCGSGKKYKKCCGSKNKVSASR